MHFAFLSAASAVAGVFVTVYNPWGCDGKTYDSNPSDGLLRLSLGVFQAQFSALAICMA